MSAGEAASRFADSANRLFGQCALLLGWRPHEFWSSTPAEVAAIRDALRAPESQSSVSRSEIERLMEIDDG